ncbi:MAG TPA: peptidylprolyl isomerase [Steroidobacter sp.]|uniref:peptidylprolyl isomerase n=1 Tax=Steroidobacter sp. TaxID=1978227 RepID=UPI002EDAC156
MVHSRIKALLREPLLHFLLLGTALFVAYGHFNQDAADADPQTIVVDRDNLLTFIQFRSRAFDAATFQQALDRLSEEELQQLIKDYTREEALYREAKALQLDKNDYVSRLRLIQQLEFITRGFTDAQVEVTEQEIQRHYETHESEYRVQPKVTFTHVFFSSDRHGAKEAEALARAELKKLNGGRVRFDQAPGHGERFLYHVNYVAREAEEVASHFGEDMQTQLFALKPDDKQWRGPFQSPYGSHLVMLTQHEAGYLPSFDEVRARVEQEARQAAMDARFEESIQSIVDAYDVEVRREAFAALSGGQKTSEKDQKAQAQSSTDEARQKASVMGSAARTNAR